MKTTGVVLIIASFVLAYLVDGGYTSAVILIAGALLLLAGLSNE